MKMMKKIFIILLFSLLLIGFFKGPESAQLQDKTEELIKQLRDNSAGVRYRAAKTLAGSGWIPQDDNEKAYYFIVTRQWNKCVELGAPAVEPIISIIKEDQKNNTYDMDLIKTLVKTGDSRAVEPLVSVLKHFSEPLIIVRALEKIGDTRAIKPLVDYMESCWDDKVREVVIETLGKFGKPAIKLLIRRLQHDEGDVKFVVIKALGKIGGDQAVDPLAMALKYKFSGSGKEEVVKALSQIGGNQIVEPLIIALKETEGSVKDATLEALSKAGGNQATKAIADELNKYNNDYWLAKRIAEVLDKLGWMPGNDTEKTFYFIAKNEWNKCIELGKPAVEILITTLKEGNWNAREGAVEVLGKIKDIRAVEPLIEILKSNDSSLRYRAVRSLGEIGDPRAIVPLIDILKKEDRYYGNIWTLAKETLIKIGKPAVGSLIITLKDGNKRVRSTAIEALSDIGDSTAAGPLVNLLKDNEVCEKTAITLDKLGWIPGNDEEKLSYYIAKKDSEKLISFGEKAVGPLINTLKEKDWHFRWMAVEALGGLKDNYSIAALILALKDNTLPVRKGAAEALIKINKPAVKPLINALKDRDNNFRIEVMNVLCAVGDNRAIGPIAGLLRDDDWHVRKKASTALDKSGWMPGNENEKVYYYISKKEWDNCVKLGIPAIDPLIILLKDKDNDIRIAAIKALGELRSKKAVSDLNILAEDKDADISGAAKKALEFIYARRVNEN